MNELTECLDRARTPIATIGGVCAAIVAAALAAPDLSTTAMATAIVTGASTAASSHFVNRIRIPELSPDTQQNHDLVRSLRLMVYKRIEHTRVPLKRFETVWPVEIPLPEAFPSSLSSDLGPILARLVQSIADIKSDVEKLDQLDSEAIEPLPDITFGSEEEWKSFLKLFGDSAASLASEFARKGLWWFLFEIRHDAIASRAFEQYLHALAGNSLTAIQEMVKTQGEDLTYTRKILDEFKANQVTNNKAVLAKLSELSRTVRGIESVVVLTTDGTLPSRKRALEEAPKWADVRAKYTFPRTKGQGLLDLLLDECESLRAYKLVGPPGAGKRTELMRLATLLVNPNHGKDLVFYCTNPSSLRLDLLPQKGAFLFVHAGTGDLDDLWNQAAILSQTGSNLVIVAATNSEKVASTEVRPEEIEINMRLDTDEQMKLSSLLIAAYASTTNVPDADPRETWLERRALATKPYSEYDLKKKIKTIRSNYLKEDRFSQVRTWNGELVGSLDDVYIPLCTIEVSGRSEDLISHFESKFANLTLPRIALLGPPGSGKSTGLASFIRLCASDSQRFKWNGHELLPLYVSLSQISDSDCELTALVARGMCHQTSENPQELIALWNHLISNGQALVLLDGVDVNPRAARIISSLPGFQDCPMIVTCRSTSKSDLPSGFEEVYIEAITLSSSETYIRNFFIRNKELGEALINLVQSDQSFAGLASVPSDLSIMCQIALNSKSASQIPSTRVGLFHEMLQQTWQGLGERRDANAPTHGINPKRLQSFLESACFEGVKEMLRGLEAHVILSSQLAGDDLIAERRLAVRTSQRANTGTIAVDLVLQIIKHELPGVDDKLLEDMARSSRIIDVNGEEWLFKHRLLHEYMIATALCERLVRNETDAYQITDRLSWLPNFEETLLLMFGDLGRRLAKGDALMKLRIQRASSRLLDLLSNPDYDDASNHRLLLANKCLREFNHARISAASS
jgi:hypothetical protein